MTYEHVLSFSVIENPREKQRKWRMKEIEILQCGGCKRVVVGSNMHYLGGQCICTPCRTCGKGQYDNSLHSSFPPFATLQFNTPYFGQNSPVTATEVAKPPKGTHVYAPERRTKKRP